MEKNEVIDVSSLYLLNKEQVLYECETHVLSSADTQNIKVYLFKCSLDWYTCFPPLVQQSECLETNHINQLTVLKSVTSCVMNSSHTVSCLESVLYICIMICKTSFMILLITLWSTSSGSGSTVWDVCVAQCCGSGSVSLDAQRAAERRDGAGGEEEEAHWTSW